MRVGYPFMYPTSVHVVEIYVKVVGYCLCVFHDKKGW